MERDRTKDWRELCKAAANEPDPAKLMGLIAELTKALDERDRKRRYGTGGQADENDGGTRSLGRQAAVGQLH